MARVLARVLARAGRDREDEARDVAFVFLDLDLMGIISPSELVGGVLEVFVVKEKSFSEREELDATWKCRDNPFSLFEDDVESGTELEATEDLAETQALVRFFGGSSGSERINPPA